MSNHGWFGVDLDGTLARYDGWVGIEHIGVPILPMVERIRGWIAGGYEVRIFTARVSLREPELVDHVTRRIQDWLEEEAGLPRLAVTNIKDFHMIALYDDRAVQVRFNTGELVE